MFSKLFWTVQQRDVQITDKMDKLVKIFTSLRWVLEKNSLRILSDF